MRTSPFDLNQQNAHLESKIVAAFERVAQAFRVLLWQESKVLGLSPIQIQVLIFLLHHAAEKRKVSYLAAEFNLSKATISDTIKTLDQKGLLEKEYLPQDTRSYILHLSAQGEKLAQQAALFANDIQQPIDRLTLGEKERLFAQLTGIIDHLNKAGVISIQRMCLTCSFYVAHRNGMPHYCRLLEKALEQAELRIDCPEHHPVEVIR